MVFLHGIGGSSETWASQYDSLSDDYRVIGWDMPGYGGSEGLAASAPGVDDYVHALVALLDALGMPKVHLLGQSVAAPIAARFVRRYPQRAFSFIVCHGLAGFGCLPVAEREAEKRKRLRAFEEHGPERFARERTPTLLGPLATPQTIETTVSVMARVRPEGYCRAVEMLATANIFADLPHVSVPALVLCGDADPVTTPEAGQAIAAALPGARFRVFKGVGHYSCIEDSNAFDETLRSFLDLDD